MFSQSRHALALVVSLAVLSLPGHAAITGYTSNAAFTAAIGSSATPLVVNFDSFSAGSTFASGASFGSGVNAVSFSYSIAGSQLAVSNLFETTSGTRSLGLNNGNQSFDFGDSFAINFSRAMYAVGLYVITAPNSVFAGDFRLASNTGSVVNSATADRTLPLGSKAYFLGIVDSNPLNTFTSVTLSSDITSSGALLQWNVDDITAVPEPGSVALMLAGLGCIGWLCRRRSA